MRSSLAHIVILFLSLAAEGAHSDSTLNISIAVFDPGLPADQSLYRAQQVFPRVREIEAKFLPFVLRDTLVKTQEWGAVRVVPRADVAAELLVSGTIVRSNGETLELKIRAVDASGRVWLDEVFAGAVENQGLFVEIANSLLEIRAQEEEAIQLVRSLPAEWRSLS